MRRLLVFALVVTACAQQPPPRAPLPAVETAVPPSRPCAALVGEPQGATVVDVLEGSAADGVLMPGDLVVAFQGSEVATATDLQNLVRSRRAEEEVELEVNRNGSLVRLGVRLGGTAEGRPLLGVMIRTAYPEVGLSELPERRLRTPLARLVEAEGILLGLDPVGAELVATDIPPPPEGEWFGVDGVVYRLEGARLVSSRGATLPLPAVPTGLLGADGRAVLVAIPDGDQHRILRVEVPTGSTEEVLRISDGEPLAVLASPDGSRLLLASVGEEGRTPTFSIVAGGERRVLPSTLRAVFGWFDDRRILVQPAGGGLQILDPDGGTVQPVELPSSTSPELEIWGVGDGAHLLVRDDGTLTRLSVDPSEEARDLLVRCRIDRIDLPGSA